MLFLCRARVREQEESHLMARLCEREHVLPVRRHQRYRFLPSLPRRGLAWRYPPDAADKGCAQNTRRRIICHTKAAVLADSSGPFFFGSPLMIAFLQKCVLDSKMTRSVWTFSDTNNRSEETPLVLFRGLMSE